LRCVRHAVLHQGRLLHEKFEAAFKQFKTTNNPFIFTYAKDVHVGTGNDRILDWYPVIDRM